jgi:hypothetical protein
MAELHNAARPPVLHQCPGDHHLELEVRHALVHWQPVRSQDEPRWRPHKRGSDPRWLTRIQSDKDGPSGMGSSVLR